MAWISGRYYRQCGRCGLHYELVRPSCSHCTGLDEEGAEKLKQQHQAQLVANTGLGRVMLYVAVVLCVALAALS